MKLPVKYIIIAPMMGTKTKKKPAGRKKTGNAKKQNKHVLLIVIGVVLVLAGMFGAFFALRGGNRYAGNVIRLDKEVATGIDVSSHNGKIDWKKVKGDTDFAFIRAGFRGYTEGEINEDKQLKYNLKYANKYGVPVGVYFYSQAVTDEEAQEEAAFVLSKIKNYDISLPVVIDFEYATKNGNFTGRQYAARLSNKQRTSLINAFCDKVRKAGYTPGIYASSYIYKTYLNMKSIDSDVFIWVADYNDEVGYKGFYDIWQYSDKGKCKGVSSKAVDLNRWYITNRLQD